ncbi:TorF family putative porin [Solimonas variicoloris]|uniref:TorF family putative porin n=1 Tax=Solimonas variicoloris TaxID=254408 RepID=UPI0003645BD7|nr:TorF family putative porin [Solimonas variicoloris]
MEFKRSVLGAVLVGAAAFSGSAFAGVTGNVGAVSEYMFRGVSQGSGAAIQGGVDYAHDSGVYVGLWGSNVDWGVGGAETDVYAGYATKFGDVGFDIGALYYYYAEYKEDAYGAAGINPNTFEGYVKVSYGPVALQYYYSPHYFGGEEANGDDLSNSYIALVGAFPITDSVNLNVSVGDTISSDDVYVTKSDGSTKKSYVDYSLGVSKAIDETLTASFSVIGSTLKYDNGTDYESDKPKFVIGIKKTFAL